MFSESIKGTVLLILQLMQVFVISRASLRIVVVFAKAGNTWGRVLTSSMTGMFKHVIAGAGSIAGACNFCSVLQS